MDSQKRIRELEEQVGQLQEQIEASKRHVHESATHTAGHAITGGGVWDWGEVWLRRVVLVFTAGVALAATLVAFRGESLSVAQAFNLGRDAAAIPMNYRLLACALVTSLAVLSYILKRRGLFIGLGLAAVYLTYVLCLSMVAVDRFRFWFPFAFLTVSYVLFSGACVLDGRKPGTGRRRRLAMLAGVNSLVYFLLAWATVTEYAPGRAWMFRVWFTLLLVGFAVVAETSGHRRNYLFQLFSAKAVLLFVFTLEVFLPGQRFWIATAAACVALAVAYRLSGVVALKVTNLFLLLVTFTGALRAVKTSASVTVGSVAVPENWLVAGVAIAACMLLAWFYERRVFPGRPKPARISGHWFLAGTPLDVPGATASMLHAAAGALILLSFTILEVGEYEPLGWALALEGAALALLGLALFTPQIEVAGLLLLVGAHVSLWFRVFQSSVPLDTGGRFPWYAGLIAGLTFWAAYRWERYLARIRGAGPWEHYLAASVPYVLGTGLLSLLAARQFPGIVGLALQSVLGIGVFALGWGLNRPTVKLAGLGALAIGALTYAQQIQGFGSTAPGLGQPAVYLGLLLVTYVGGERLIRLLERRKKGPTPGDEPARSLLVVGGTTLALLMLYEWVDAGTVTLVWASVPAVAIALAAVTGDVRYGWAAFVGLCCMAGRTFWWELADWDAPYWHVSLAITGGLFAVAFWKLRQPLPSPESGPQHESRRDTAERHG